MFRFSLNSKPHDYQQNLQKMQDLSKTTVSTRKQFEELRRKKRTETQFSTLRKHPVEHTAPKYNSVIWQILCKL